MFHRQSGGGPGVAINNATEIVPRGFMNGNKGSSVYVKTEKEMYNMVNAHFHGNDELLTEFSSWAASLHAVLCFARDTRADWNPHVAVIDRMRLEGEVLVWWVPDLLGAKQGDIEYLAHGCIRGRGYTAVPFEQLVTNGLYSLFPELEAWKKNRSKGMPFGRKLRKRMFHRAPPVDISTEDIATAKKIGILFGDLALPVMAALLCLRPREATGFKEMAVRVIESLSTRKVEFELATGFWAHPGATYTRKARYRDTGRWYPDIEQWIKLLRAINSHDFRRDTRKRKRASSDSEYEPDTEDYTNRYRSYYNTRKGSRLDYTKVMPARLGKAEDFVLFGSAGSDEGEEDEALDKEGDEASDKDTDEVLNAKKDEDMKKEEQHTAMQREFMKRWLKPWSE
ncbi:hypothetical protein AA0113_g9857 [Alternaria arborescens]|uniref:DUF7587 domain-containing protein n=1 Tax=Alternaria arborescens TaxID=156630 RepID=A0A4Q4QYN8_9PLEO|nr:hypothetical protein AA0111_g11199 [Alternaria arborescens]RYO17052.1 hypothetical protein AA0111_g11199 [Alternaria arborescens]RYO48912.1 hypothetical protein AA0113_g9857 [Alternaria arborescens]